MIRDNNSQDGDIGRRVPGVHWNHGIETNVGPPFAQIPFLAFVYLMFQKNVLESLQYSTSSSSSSKKKKVRIPL